MLGPNLPKDIHKANADSQRGRGRSSLPVESQRDDAPAAADKLPSAPASTTGPDSPGPRKLYRQTAQRLFCPGRLCGPGAEARVWSVPLVGKDVRVLAQIAFDAVFKSGPERLVRRQKHAPLLKDASSTPLSVLPQSMDGVRIADAPPGSP